MLYKCRGCKESKERKEFHYKNFETSIPRKLCWGCEIKESNKVVIESHNKMVQQKNKEIESLLTQLKIQKKLTNGVQSISFDQSMVKDGMMKHKNLNVYMHKNNPNDAYFKMKGKYRKYKPIQSQYDDSEMCIIYKMGYKNKWYALSKMHQWIMEEGNRVEAPF